MTEFDPRALADELWPGNHRESGRWEQSYGEEVAKAAYDAGQRSRDAEVGRLTDAAGQAYIDAVKVAVKRIRAEGRREGLREVRGLRGMLRHLLWPPGNEDDPLRWARISVPRDDGTFDVFTREDVEALLGQLDALATQEPEQTGEKE